MEDTFLKNGMIPILFLGMLSGGQPMDVYSRQKLIKDIKLRLRE